MEFRKLGRTGLKVSELCMGTMQFGWTADEELSYKILTKAYDAGVNFIDTADVYSQWVEGNPGGVSEQIIGKWIKKNKIPRSNLVMATKVRGRMGKGPNDEGLSRAHIFNAVEDSLRRLDTDYIDLYQTHWYDEETPIDETLKAMDDLVRQGKVRYVGCSNYPGWRLVESLWSADKYGTVRYDCLQPHYSLVHRKEFEDGLMEVCSRFGIGVIPYSPLAGGFLTGKYKKVETVPDSERANGVRRRYFNDYGWSVLDAVTKIADERKMSVSQISLAWLLANPVISSPIIGPRSLEQLEDNLGAAGCKLSPEEKDMLDEISKPE